MNPVPPLWALLLPQHPFHAHSRELPENASIASQFWGGFSMGCSSISWRTLLKLSAFRLSSRPAPAPQKQPLESPAPLRGVTATWGRPEALEISHGSRFAAGTASGGAAAPCQAFGDTGRPEERCLFARGSRNFTAGVCERGEWLCTGGRMEPGHRQGPGARFVQQRGRCQREKQPRASS